MKAGTIFHSTPNSNTSSNSTLPKLLRWLLGLKNITSIHHPNNLTTSCCPRPRTLSLWLHSKAPEYQAVPRRSKHWSKHSSRMLWKPWSYNKPNVSRPRRVDQSPLSSTIIIEPIENECTYYIPHIISFNKHNVVLYHSILSVCISISPFVVLILRPTLAPATMLYAFTIYCVLFAIGLPVGLLSS